MADELKNFGPCVVIGDVFRTPTADSERISQLKDVLRIFDEVLHIGKIELQPEEIQSENHKVSPNIFSQEFHHGETSKFFYLNPNDKAIHADPSFPYFLTLIDVNTFINSVIRALQEEVRLATGEEFRAFRTHYDTLLGDNGDKNYKDVVKKFTDGFFVGKTKQDLGPAIGTFRELINKLFLPLEEEGVVKHPEAEKELLTHLLEPWTEIERNISSGARSYDSPSAYIEQLRREWPEIVRLLNDFQKTGVGADHITTQNQFGAEAWLSVNLVRAFLNQWIDTFYREEDIKARRWPYFSLRNWLQRDLPNRPQLPSAETSGNAFYYQFGTIQELDIQVINEILNGALAEIIRLCLQTPIPNAPTEAAAPVAEGGGGETLEEEEEKEKKPIVTEEIKAEEEIDPLVQRFVDANASYGQEAVRLNNILLEQFFRIHGFEKNLDQLELSDPANFAFVQREFSLELENVLRNLSRSDFDKLQSGDRVGFRLSVIRQLYSKLATNPKFLQHLNNYKQAYLVKSPGEKEKIDERINVDDITFRHALEEYESNLPADGDWTQDYIKNGRIDEEKVNFITARFKNENDLRQTSQADFERIFQHAVGSGVSIDYKDFFNRLDSIIAEQWSPQKLFLLSQQQIKEYLGVDLPDDFFANTPEGRLRLLRFISLCSEYVYIRRQNLADALETDEVSRTRKDVQDDDKELSAEEKKAWLDRQNRSAKAPFGARGMIVGLALDEEGLAELAKHDEALAQAGTLERAYALQNLEERRKRLLALGLLSAFEAINQAQAQLDGSPFRFGVADGVGSLLRKNLKKKTGYKNLQDEARQRLRRQAERAISNAIIPGSGAIKNDNLRRGVVVGGLAGLGLAAYQTIQNILSNLAFGGGGALIGGFGLALLFPQFAIPAFVLGALGGSALGASIGPKIADFLKKLGAPNLPSISGGATPTPAAPPSLLQLAATKGSAVLGPYVPYAIGTAVVAGSFIYMNQTTLDSFIPPLPTVSNGEISKYVTITKHADPGIKFNTPQAITYTISIQAKSGYKITLTDVPTDQVTITKNPSGTAPVPNDQSYQSFLSSLSSLKGQSFDDSTNKQIGQYTLSLNSDQYRDSSVDNTFAIKFTVTDKSGKPVTEGSQSIFDATTGESVCFGNCPATAGGLCWPADGIIAQYPYSQYSNNFCPQTDADTRDYCPAGFPSCGGTHCTLNEDAFDITVNGFGAYKEEVHAPFDGKACLYSDLADNTWGPAKNGSEGSPSYGISVTLAGTYNGQNFTLLFAHLASTNIPSGCTTVNKNDALGLLGNSGYSSQAHLHYELLGHAHPTALKNFVPKNYMINQPVRSFCAASSSTGDTTTSSGTNSSGGGGSGNSGGH